MAKQDASQYGENKDNSERSSSKPNFASSSEQLDLLFQVLRHDGVMEQALFTKRENKPDWVVKVRELLSQRFAELIGVTRVEVRLGNVVDGLTRVQDELDRYQSRLELRVSDLLPKGDLKKRFESEYPDEKRVIANFVSGKYFTAPLRCFLQASTFLLHLAESLRALNNGRGSVIHTNSTVFPWLLLGLDSKYTVYATCGQFHDPLCCGWLFSPADKEAQEHIRNLFIRSQDPLSTAIITPQHLTLDGALHFALEATAELVEILVRESPKLVILIPAQRIRRDRAEFQNSNHVWHSVDVSKVRMPSSTPDSLEIVLAGDFPNGIGNDDFSSLREIGTLTCLKVS